MPNYLIDEKKNLVEHQEENTPVLIKKSLNIGNLTDERTTLPGLVDFATELNPFLSQIYSIVFRERYGTYICTDYDPGLRFRFPRESDNLLEPEDLHKLGYIYIYFNDDQFVYHVYDPLGNEFTKTFQNAIMDFYILA